LKIHFYALLEAAYVFCYLNLQQLRVILSDGLAPRTSRNTSRGASQHVVASAFERSRRTSRQAIDRIIRLRKPNNVNSRSMDNVESKDYFTFCVAFLWMCYDGRMILRVS